MASTRAIEWIERLIWMLIYGGLGAMALGSFTRRQAPATGTSLIVVGAVAVVAGVVLIYVRSRLDHEPAAAAPADSSKGSS